MGDCRAEGGGGREPGCRSGLGLDGKDGEEALVASDDGTAAPPVSCASEGAAMGGGGSEPEGAEEVDLEVGLMSPLLPSPSSLSGPWEARRGGMMTNSRSSPSST